MGKHTTGGGRRVSSARLASNPGLDNVTKKLNDMGFTTQVEGDLAFVNLSGSRRYAAWMNQEQMDRLIQNVATYRGAEDGLYATFSWIRNTTGFMR